VSEEFDAYHFGDSIRPDGLIFDHRLRHGPASTRNAITLRLEDVRRLDEVYGETQMSSNLTSYALAIVTVSVLVLSAAGLYADEI